jgi:tetratricopeptide (TPR) repeat protein
VVAVLVAVVAGILYRPAPTPPRPAPKPLTLAVRPFASIATNLRIRLGARLNPDSTNVLTGTLQATEESLKLDIRLAPSGWSKHFERPASEAAALEQDAAQAVATELKLPLHSLEDHTRAEALTAHAHSLWNPEHGFPHQPILAEYRRALALYPQLPEAHSELSWVLFHVGEPAVDEARQAVDFDPENPDYRLRLAIANIYAGKYQDAIDLFKTIPRTHSPLLWYANAAWAHLELRQTTRANYYLEEYARLYGVDTDGLMSSVNAMLQARYNNPHQASLAIAAALEDPVDHGYFHHTAYNVSRAYKLLGKPADAQFWLQQAQKNGFPHPPSIP